MLNSFQKTKEYNCIINHCSIRILTGCCDSLCGLYPANERRRYFVTTSLIGWMQALYGQCRVFNDLMVKRRGKCICSYGIVLARWIGIWRVNSWWRHQMETFSAWLALCAGNSPVPVNSPHKSQWRGALMFYLICVWINGWVNNREAGDLRRHLGH